MRRRGVGERLNVKRACVVRVSVSVSVKQPRQRKGRRAAHRVGGRRCEGWDGRGKGESRESEKACVQPLERCALILLLKLNIRVHDVV